MSNVNNYRTLAVLANVQELVCRVIEETGGNEIALVSPEDMAQDVAACINNCVGGIKGATA